MMFPAIIATSLFANSIHDTPKQLSTKFQQEQAMTNLCAAILSIPQAFFPSAMKSQLDFFFLLQNFLLGRFKNQSLHKYCQFYSKRFTVHYKVCFSQFPFVLDNISRKCDINADRKFVNLKSAVTLRNINIDRLMYQISNFT